MTLRKRPELKTFYLGSQTKEEILAQVSANKQIDFSEVSTVVMVATFLIVLATTYSISMALILAIFASIPARAITYCLRSIFVDSKKETQVVAAQEALEQIQRYESALKDYVVWEEARNSETSEAYWRRFKGIALEDSVAAMLRRTGWAVTTTKATGDGGVDLKARRDGQYYYIQCKGHNSRIGVATIRDAAGVSSTAGVKVIVVAPSGFSSPARDFAAKAGVELWDSASLANIASGTD